MAYACTGNDAYLETATRNMHFLFSKMQGGDGLFFHTWKGEAKINAFLDGYSYLIDALLELSSVSGDWSWTLKASDLAKVVIKHFSETSSPLFLFTPDFQTDILIRKKEVYDGATPSGNAVMARSLYHLGILLDKPEWRQRAEDMVLSMANVATRYPTSFGLWLDMLIELNAGTSEVAVVGKNAKDLAREIMRLHIPYRLLVFSDQAHQEIPLLAEKNPGVETLIFLCKNYVCKTPVKTAFALEELINQNKSQWIQ
jgi:uncharacterized protein YyaL (SSP411 family)